MSTSTTVTSQQINKSDIQHWMLAVLFACLLGFSAGGDILQSQSLSHAFNQGTDSHHTPNTSTGTADVLVALPQPALLSGNRTHAAIELLAPTIDKEPVASITQRYTALQSTLWITIPARFYFVVQSFYARPYSPRSPPTIL